MKLFSGPRRETTAAAYFGLLSGLGLDRMASRWAATRQRALILNFHRVSDVDSPFWPPLRPKLFGALVEWLRLRADVVTFGDLDSGLPKGGRPAVILSFDDGYEDFGNVVAPILGRLGVRANLNVIGHSVVTQRPPWNVRLYDALAASPPNQLRELRVPGFTPSDDLRPLSFGLALSRHLKLMTPADRAQIWPAVERFIDRIGEHPHTRMLGAAEIRSLAREHEIGSHSYSHESMAFVDNDQFKEDFVLAQTAIGEVLGRAPTIYAFPNGSYRREQVAYLLSSGIDHVLLVGERPSRADGSVYTRITMHGKTLPELRLRATGHRPPRKP